MKPVASKQCHRSRRVRYPAWALSATGSLKCWEGGEVVLSEASGHCDDCVNQYLLCYWDAAVLQRARSELLMLEMR